MKILPTPTETIQMRKLGGGGVGFRVTGEAEKELEAKILGVSR